MEQRTLDESNVTGVWDQPEIKERLNGDHQWQPLN